MIVVSSNVVLAEVLPTGYTADNGVIGWHNLVTRTGVSATSAADTFPASNVANPMTFLGWKATSTADQYITLTPSSVTGSDYIGIVRHNLGSQGVMISIEEPSEEETSGWAEIFAPFIPADDAPLIIRFAEANRQQIRIKLVHQDPSVGDPAQIATIYWGLLLTLQRRIYVPHSPFAYAREYDAVNGMSESGDFIGRIITGEAAGTSVELKNLTPDWYRATFDPFLIAARTRPFFFAWRPGQYPLEVAYCWLTNKPKVSNQRTNGMMQIDLELAGIVS